jgi:hypothetical protein
MASPVQDDAPRFMAIGNRITTATVRMAIDWLGTAEGVPEETSHAGCVGPWECRAPC